MNSLLNKLSLGLLLLLLLPAPAALAYYDPGVQRWINRDPQIDRGVLSLGIGQAQPGYAMAAMTLDTSARTGTREASGTNPYTFTGNDPQDAIDPDGMWWHLVCEILKHSCTPAGGPPKVTCTQTGVTVYKSPSGVPVRRSCHYMCEAGGDEYSAYPLTIDVSPRTPCPTGQDVSSCETRKRQD